MKDRGSGLFRRSKEFHLVPEVVIQLLLSEPVFSSTVGTFTEEKTRDMSISTILTFSISTQADGLNLKFRELHHHPDLDIQLCSPAREL